jgi:hypothetical protein
MRTLTLNRILGLLILISLLASCSLKKANYKDVIPASSKMLVALDFKSLSQKANFKDGNYKFVDLLTSELNNTSPELAKIVSEAEKDAAATGIDINEDIYVFMYEKSTKLLGGVMKLADAQKFEILINEVLKTTKAKLSIQEDGIKYIGEEKGSVILSWNNDFALVLGNTNTMDTLSLLEEVKSLYDQGSANSIKSNEFFGKILEKQADISYGVDFSLYTDLMKKISANAPMPIPINMNSIMKLLEGSSMVSYTNFETGEIRSEAEYVFGEKMKEMMEKYPVIRNFDTGVLPAFFPKKSLALMSFGVNFKNYYGFLKEIMSAGIFAIAEMGIESQMGIKMDDFLNSIKGDFLFSFTDLTNTANTMTVDLNFAFSLNDGKLNEKIKSLLAMVAKQGENYFTIQAGIMPIYLSMNDELIMATSNKATANAFAKGGLGDISLNKSDYISSMGKYSTFMFIDIESIVKLEAVKAMLANSIIALNPAAINMVNLFKSIELQTTDNPVSLNGIIKMNTDKNALQAIFESADELMQ